ncbi:variant erythrocyte surface antigen-1 family protein [Babesia caballi]|uniref:Variant erythrocyte surface antigen-1 family protein n=1 Tax=Babesia caballi TaxID=5871 RepID=A0AAV4LUH7_BABCB|nr:variant erythrocyte surface antigen-1 family protein [Babesia caballi]
MLALSIPLCAPVNPSFDRSSNLKEAIDWILRVTGKDGGGGDQAIEALTNQVKNLLSEVGKSETKLGKDIDKVIQALSTGGTGLITKLAEGLQQFIGYEATSSNTNGHLTGAGIAPSNMATHRLCDATIAFTIGVLEGCKGKVKRDHVTMLDSVITKLHAKYGTGTQGLKEVATEVKSGLNGLFTGTQINQFVNDIETAFETNLKSLNGQGDSAENVALKVGAYLKGIFEGTKGRWQGDADQAASKLQALVTNLNKNTYNTTEKSFGGNIQQVQNALKVGSHKVVQPILEAGKNAFMGALKMPNYTSKNYEDASSIKWTSDTANVQTCAQIILGCLPLYYQALTYIYWGCHENGGGWGNQTLANGSMRSYFDSQGLLPTFVDRSKRGAHIAETALGGFSEFQAAASSLKDSNSPYVKLTNQLQANVRENSAEAQTLSSKCPLSALFHGASCYFRCQQITTTKSAGGTPKTIREMLYFLAALQFSSAYEGLNNHIGTALQKTLDVADSSDRNSNNTLSADQLNEYLTASCSLSSAVLGTLQGGNGTGNSDPWLHELFCNSAFHFKYPSSSSTLFNTLSSYAYALQFQLLFLYSMCANNVNKCGWQDCIFGKGMKPNGSGGTVPSHICTGLKCQSGSCNHYSGQCRHTFHANNNNNPTCGKATNSPPPSLPHGLHSWTLPQPSDKCHKSPGHVFRHPVSCTDGLSDHTSPSKRC